MPQDKDSSQIHYADACKVLQLKKTIKIMLTRYTHILKLNLYNLHIGAPTAKSLLWVQNIANKAALAISGGLVTNTVIKATDTNTKVFDTSSDPRKTKFTDDNSNTAILTNMSEGKANVPTNLFKPILAA